MCDCLPTVEGKTYNRYSYHWLPIRDIAVVTIPLKNYGTVPVEPLVAISSLTRIGRPQRTSRSRLFALV